MENEGTPNQIAKLCLLVQAYVGIKSGFITHPPTVQISLQLILFLIAAKLPSSLSEWKQVARDITPACNQLETTVSRPVFSKTPADFETSPNKLHYLTKPLPRLPVAGVHWIRTYHCFLRDSLRMHSDDYDLCNCFSPEFF